MWNAASATWQNVYRDTDLSAAATFKIDSTLTDLGGEGAFIIFPIPIPLVSEYKWIVTGVNSNPTDTVVTLAVTRK